MRGCFCRALPVLLMAGLLPGCGMLTGWFGERDAPPLPGERLPVLRSEVNLQPDPTAAELAVTMPRPILNSDWPQAGGTPDHAPVHLELGEDLQRLWSVRIGAGGDRGQRILSPPVVADGRVYAMDATSSVTAVESETGRRVWTVDMTPERSAGGFGGGLAAAGGRVFVTTGYGEVAALDGATGEVVWRRSLPTPVRAAPTLAGGRVYAVAIENRLEALDASTGAPVWSHAGIAETASVLGAASPAVARGAVVVPYSSGEIFALREENGRLLWTDNLTAIRRADVVSELADIRGLPVAYRGFVFAASHSGRSAAIDLGSGNRVWDRDFGGINMPWLAGDFLFMVTNNNELLGAVAADGRIRWVNAMPVYADETRRQDRILWAGPVLAGNRLIMVNSLGRTAFFSPSTGERLGDFGLAAPAHVPPVVANRTLYILTEDATLTAYR